MMSVPIIDWIIIFKIQPKTRIYTMYMREQ